MVSASALPAVGIILILTDIHVLRLSTLRSSYTLSSQPQKVVASIVIEVMEEIVESAYVSGSILMENSEMPTDDHALLL
jgi:hypothetical protein